MRRREFVVLVASTAIYRPLAVYAQRSEQMRRVAVLAPFNEKDPESQVNFSAFKKRLIDLGGVEGRNLTIEYRFTRGGTVQIRAAALELFDEAISSVMRHWLLLASGR